ncbi:syntaxin-7 isoform X2 [Protopterus annectens]|uniref:syntaxin-7 isoform X2 n=1 Tax=Protopterus annectens TaxID=7888 RepID=UPI001CFA4C8E|nr:syntaxin-7 isoform X2 [Protopterus annectens]
MSNSVKCKCFLGTDFEKNSRCQTPVVSVYTTTYSEPPALCHHFSSHVYQPALSAEASTLTQSISVNIQKITHHTNEIQRILQQFGTPRDTPELRQQLQQKLQLVNHLSKETEKKIKEFTSLSSSADQQRQRKLQKERLLGDFTTALTNFQRIQRQAAEKEREFVNRVRSSSRASGNFAEDGGKDLLHTENEKQNQLQVQDDITEDDLRLIEERESAIKQLESDILDINEIFKDLGVMIHEQGDMIDSIEANVENAEVHVQSANQQLARASQYQSKSRKKICILIVVLVLAAVIIGLIIWATTRK